MHQCSSRSDIRTETGNKIREWNACYFGLNKIIVSRLLSSATKLKIHKTVILSLNTKRELFRFQVSRMKYVMLENRSEMSKNSDYKWKFTRMKETASWEILWFESITSFEFKSVNAEMVCPRKTKDLDLVITSLVPRVHYIIIVIEV